MGNIPERSTFRLPVLKSALVPYFQIVQGTSRSMTASSSCMLTGARPSRPVAVRVGDLSAFQTALSTHGPTFRADGTHTLILRLRHNVIKTGLAQIAQAYSKISLRDICAKLQLEGEEDAEYIVAKAIRDGVVPPGVGVDHAKGWLVGSDKADVLETAEPRKVFGKRIDFCLQLHNESVKVCSAALCPGRLSVPSFERMLTLSRPRHIRRCASRSTPTARTSTRAPRPASASASS
jgi:26S proteasome regulatory subunit N3